MRRYIQLLETEKGLIKKNESYSFQEIHSLVLAKNRSYFHFPLLGVLRRHTLRVILHTLHHLIDKDQKGRHRVALRSKTG